jgi:hypothetical protein
MRRAATPGEDDASFTAATDMSAGGVIWTLTEFGFGVDEATYLEHRLAAGAALVALTTGSPDTFQAARRIFADHDAVYVGMAQTDARVVAEAEALLAAAPEASSGGNVVVTDAVAPLHRVCADGGSGAAAALCGRLVVDQSGDDVGTVEEVLADAVESADAPGTERLAVRYVVIGFGGVLGLGHRRVPLPVAVVDIEDLPLRLTVGKEVLQRAPTYDDDVPFSRREEQAVCAYFGCTPYWLGESEVASRAWEQQGDHA